MFRMADKHNGDEESPLASAPLCGESSKQNDAKRYLQYVYEWVMLLINKGSLYNYCETLVADSKFTAGRGGS